jgi:hemolysin III
VTVPPRLRGVFHQYAFFAAVGTGTVLVVLADGMRARFATWVFVAALAACFGVSALYHRVPWRSPGMRSFMRRLDHSAIFLLVAGTYTPFVLLGLQSRTATAVLVIVWAGAALGIAVKLAWIGAPRWMTATACLALGWVGVLLLPEVFSSVGVAPATLALIGGGLYTLGAIVYAVAWPNPIPAWLGFHEVFHLLTIAAATVQLVAVSLIAL